MVFHGTNGDFVGMTMIDTYILDLSTLEITYQEVIIVQGERTDGGDRVPPPAILLLKSSQVKGGDELMP